MTRKLACTLSFALLFCLALPCTGSAADVTLRVLAERPYIVGDVPVDITVEVVTKDGTPSSEFDGTRPELSGVATRQPDGTLTPLRRGPPLQQGRAPIGAVVVTDDTVLVRVAELSAGWSPRRIPGFICLVPPIVAILLALITREVLFALFLGIYLGVLAIEGWDPITALWRSIDRHILETVADSGHSAVLLFTAALGGMIGVISRSGGMEALVRILVRRVRGRKGGMVAGWLLGVLIFFDDYANCMLVGSTLRPFTDRLRISREKLSFIVDSTAAPVATIALVSTWVGYQLSQFADAGVVPASKAYDLFLHCLPYSFYSIFAIVFVFLVSVTERDFGPMLAAERRAVSMGRVLRDGAKPLTETELASGDPVPDRPVAILVPAVTIPVMIGLVLYGLYSSGRAALGAAAATASLRDILGNADAYQALLWASFGGGFLAIIMARLLGLLTLARAIEAWVAGCRSMMMALIILVLAWTIGDVCRNYLFTGPWLVARLHPPPLLIPAAVFLASSVISFSTGTSFGTMAIVIPVAAPMVWAATGDASGFDPAMAASIRYATLASVLSGAVFGDHCSPLSDTTILSSIASAADHIDHVRTQLPYASLCATVAILVGYLPAGFGVHPAWSLAIGTLVLVAVILFFGRPPQAETA